MRNFNYVINKGMKSKEFTTKEDLKQGGAIRDIYGRYF